MAFKRFPSFRLITPAVLAASLFIIPACGPTEGPVGDTADTGKDVIGNVTGVKVKGQNFMMPSPVQIALLVRSSNVGYDKTLLNPTSNVSNYNDKMKWALNIGVYGADLGYITMYEQTPEALPYFNTVRKLGDNLKITASFDEKLMTRFSENIGKNRDSVLAIVGEAYRRSDDFLKQGERDEDAALILTGGWIESMHFAVDVQKKKPSNEVSTRIAEQKNTVSNLIKLLVSVGTDPNTNTLKEAYQPLIDKLNDLNSVYQGIVIKYNFSAPTHDEDKHLTTINGTTDVKITEEQLKLFGEKIVAIRDYIIN
ncbi:MAG: hypothetical protein FD123_4316 [Bacteroidetes bacterium]|nr:MAG: hypothetical protein FD123_4316 [Bacteroidota bacterium]